MPKKPGKKLRCELMELLKATDGVLSTDAKKVWSARTKMQGPAFSIYYKQLARDLRKATGPIRTGKRQRDKLGRYIKVLFALTSEATCAAVRAALGETARVITRALIMHMEFIDKTLNYADPKDLELRAKTCQPGWLYLVGKGGLGIIGEVEIIGCESTSYEKLRTADMCKRHKIDPDSDFLWKYKQPHLWRFANARRYDEPIPWKPARGCQDWCRAGVPSKFSPSEYYEVQEIVDSRVTSSGGNEYLVGWLGYPDSANTWEPEKGVCHLTDMLAAFQ